MDEKQKNSQGFLLRRSKFIWSLFLKIILIFLIAIIGIIGVAFFSFTTEINRNIISDKQKQLNWVEDSITNRIEELSSIAYNIGNDASFFIDPIADTDTSGYEMTKTLRKYLAGNDFIEHLVLYRLSEPKMVSSSNGKMTFHDFFSTYLSLTDCTEEEYLKLLTGTTIAGFLPVQNTEDGDGLFSYVCGVPQVATNPKAFVLILIKSSSVAQTIRTPLNNCSGLVSIFTSDGEELYRTGNLSDAPDNSLSESLKATYFTENGTKYVKQKTVSSVNKFSYQSVIRMTDIISQSANKQLIFIVLLLVLMAVAIGITLLCIVRQFKPISNLAMSYRQNGQDTGGFIDEKNLLKDTIAYLKGDSDQKQMYENAYHEAEAANKAKSVFLSNMSHDIRTPMNAIVGMTEIAFKHLEDPRYVKDCLENVRISSQYLLDIINNVLDMSRIEAGRLKLTEEPMELRKLLNGVTTILNHSLEVKSQKLVLDVKNIRDERVIGDSVRLSQIFVNIISNSIKFTQNGGTIRLTMRQEECVDAGYGNYTFIFSDNGMGMSPEFTKKVFETFTRENKREIAKTEGTGLGMAIVKSFVEMMNGTIRCESKLSEGTSFTISLHLKLSENQSTVRNKEDAKQCSVLIVSEDNAGGRDEELLFREFTSNVDVVPTVEKARILLNGSLDKPYRFVMLRQTENDESGLKAMDALKRYIDREKTIIILAARDMLLVRKSTAFDSGISEFINLPLFRSTVCDILNEEFERRERKDENDTAQLAGMNVLLVEDNEVNRKIAKTIIKETQANIFEATNGKDAVEMFREKPENFFDIILMDVQMPLMNGYEATAAIRSIQKADAATIPIYAMTANTFDEDVRQVRECGMNGHLGKPYVPRELYRILEKNYTAKDL